jgi:hypothetical protein
MTNDIRLAARRLRYVTQAGIALVVGGSVAAAGALAAGRADGLGVLRIETEGLAPWPAALSLLAVGALLAAALLHLVRMLRQVEAGASFAAAPLRGFALFLFLAVLASILLAPLLDLAFGGRRLVLAVSGGDALMLFVTGLLFFVAKLLDEAQRVADDASQIV